MFLAHRCKRCGHPDYWSEGALYAGSAARGSTVDGIPVGTDTSVRVRGSCGLSWCPGCAHGCDYDPNPFEVDQWHGDGSVVERFFAPGDETTGVAQFAGRAYACACDTCRAVYRAATGT